MNALKKYCKQYLSSNLSIDTSCETFLFADLLDLPRLKANCIEYINKNAPAVMTTDGWKRLADEKRFDLLAQLYKNLTTKIG